MGLTGTSCPHLIEEDYTILKSLRDIGGGNLLLSLFSRNDHNGSIMFKSGDWAGQGRCTSPLRSSKPRLNIYSSVFSSMMVWGKWHHLQETKFVLWNAIGHKGFVVIHSYSPVHCNNLGYRFPWDCCSNHWSLLHARPSVVGSQGCQCSWAASKYRPPFVWNRVKDDSSDHKLHFSTASKSSLCVICTTFCRITHLFS